MSDLLVNKFMENYAIVPSLKEIGFKNRNFRGLSPSKEAPKPFFDGGSQGCRIISGYKMQQNAIEKMASGREAFGFSFKWWLFIFVTVLLPLDLIYRAGALWLGLPWYQIAISFSCIVICLALLSLGLASISLVVARLLNLLGRQGTAMVRTLNAFAGFLFLLTSFLGYFSIWLEKLFKFHNSLIVTNWKLSHLCLFIGGLTVLLAISYKRLAICKKIEPIAQRVFRINIAIVLICTLITSITVAYHQFYRPAALVVHTATREGVPRQPYPNIIMITFDALSAGHTSLHGFIRDTTPNLAALARESYVFDYAYASSNWTLPSLSSVITGKHPTNHKMINEYSLFLGESRKQNLPFILQELGYETALVWSNGFEFPWNNNLQGFKDVRPTTEFYRLTWVMQKVFSNLGLGSSSWLLYFLKLQPVIVFAEKSAEAAPNFGVFTGKGPAAQEPPHAPRFLPHRLVPENSFGQAQEFLESAPPPFFLWVHIWPPHSPYLPRKDFLYAFLKEKVLDNPDKQLEKTLSLEKLSSDDIYKLSLRYDEHIRYADHELGNFLRWLKQKGVYDQSLLIISSDHGEIFENRYIIHGGPYLYQTLIHIPLVIRLPGQTQEKRIEANVSHVDLAPTILDFLGIEAPLWMNGKSFKKALYDSRFDTGTKFSMNLSEMNPASNFKTTSIAAIHGDYKLIKYLSFSQYEMYDLKMDPNEKNNLVGQESEKIFSLKKEIDELCTPQTSK